MREKIARFLEGRYGDDQLNKFLMIIGFILVVMNLFVRQSWLILVFWVLWLFMFYRMMSRDVWKRRDENEKFMKMTLPLRNQFSLWKKQWKDKDHKYFLCPHCKQITRVPKGRGKIEITCPTCHTSFDRRS